MEFLKLSVYSDKHIHLLNQAEVAAQMGARLTRKLLRFAKQDQLELVVLDANEQVREAMNLLRTTIGENYHLRLALARDLWLIRADPGGIENAVINLTFNARDTMPDGDGYSSRPVTSVLTMAMSMKFSALWPVTISGFQYRIQALE